MKKLFIYAIVCIALSVYVIAGERYPVKAKNTSTTIAITNTSENAYSGYLEDIYIDIPSASTCTVSVATSRQTLLTATGISADTLYRPRYTVNDAAGGVLAIATNNAEKAYLWLDKITVVVTSNAAATNDATITITTK